MQLKHKVSPYLLCNWVIDNQIKQKGNDDSLNTTPQQEAEELFKRKYGDLILSSMNLPQ